MVDENTEEQKTQGPFCPACGKQVLETTEICPNCGSRVKPKRGFRHSELPKTPDGRVVSGEKSMALAIILSFIIPGTGTIYNGKVGKGLIILVASYLLTFLLFVGVIIWIYGIYDAYKLTEENNKIWYEFTENN